MLNYRTPGIHIQENSGLPGSISAVETAITLVWGTRTLSGNDNEWRYIQVRRLSIFIQESIKRSVGPVLIEPGEPETWTLIKTIIHDFLTGLWRDGALVGTISDQAFFVKAGLGETMTRDDIQIGSLKVEIGIAVLRPAEFIILRLTFNEKKTKINKGQGNMERINYIARLLKTKMEWEDLVLSDDVLKQIREIETWILHREKLMNDWEMARFLKPGYKTLFYGPAGTGKTTTAILLGKKTDRDVYRIDLSQVVSRYIGETEKNLSSLFERAESNDWILLFDEADALFGKRTSVKDSHDRYASQEVSYLLQRILDYQGLVILASSKKENIDNAFLRRLQSVIHFSLPGPDERMKLWMKGFGNSAKRDANIDLKKLAADYELSGGAIINIIQHCILDAMNRKERVIRYEDLMDGVKGEINKW